MVLLFKYISVFFKVVFKSSGISNIDLKKNLSGIMQIVADLEDNVGLP